MKKTVIKLSLAIFSLGIFNVMYAQKADERINWYNGSAP